MKEQHKNPDKKNTDTQVSVSLSLFSSNCLAVLFALSLETEHVAVKSSKTQPLYCCFFLLLSLTIPSLPSSLLCGHQLLEAYVLYTPCRYASLTKHLTWLVSQIQMQFLLSRYLSHILNCVCNMCEYCGFLCMGGGVEW